MRVKKPKKPKAIKKYDKSKDQVRNMANEVERYNKQHGTNYTYGKAMRKGIIKDDAEVQS